MASRVAQATSKEDAIIRVISFQRENHNRQIIRFDSKLLSEWQASMISVAHTAAPISGLGTMRGLPLELINSILEELDIESSLNFRKISRAAREIVINALEFGRIVTHAATCLMAMIRTGTARSYTFGELYRAMSLRHCEACHKLAAYVYLPTLTKACDKCISVDPRFLTVTLASFAKGAGWTTARLRKHLAVVKTVSGDYRGWDSFRTKPVDMINYAEALKVINNPTKSIRAGFGDQTAGMFVRRMVTAPLPFFNRRTQMVEPLLTCKGCAVKYDRRLLFEAVQNQQEYHTRLWRFLRDHSRSGMLEHFHNCLIAGHLWKCSENGTKSIKPLETKLIRKRAVKEELRMGSWHGIDSY